MAKATMVLPDGTRVNLEGNADEIATLLARFSGTNATPNIAKGTEPARKRRAPNSSQGKKGSGRNGPQRLIDDLIQENYFNSKRSIGEIQKKLRENGHIYLVHSLSTPLLRLTRSRSLRRIKEKAGWVYVN